MTRRYGFRPSNGTEGDIMRSYTCDRCVKDHDWHLDQDFRGDSCPIIMDALSGEHSYPNDDGPPQWWVDSDEHQYGCTEFEGPCLCVDGHTVEFPKPLKGGRAHPLCYRCDWDEHRCSSCGCSVDHDLTTCADCSTATREEIDLLRQGVMVPRLYQSGEPEVRS